MSDTTPIFCDQCHNAIRLHYDHATHASCHCEQRVNIKIPSGRPEAWKLQEDQSWLRCEECKMTPRLERDLGSRELFATCACQGRDGVGVRVGRVVPEEWQ